MYDECIWIPDHADHTGSAAQNEIKGVVQVKNLPATFYPQGISREG